MEKELATHPLQYSCLGNAMDRGAWWATVYGVSKELEMTDRPNYNKAVTLVLSSRCF